MISPFILSMMLLFVSGNTGKIITVSSDNQLQQALQIAKPGDKIVVKAGIYFGNFTIPTTANGTASQPIVLRGEGKVVLNGGTIIKGYVLHLTANYWVIKNIELTNGLKGLMCDNANYNILDSISVNNIGQEGIHFRHFSTHNILQNSTIINTGLKTPDYGEGVYIGTAVSNWQKITAGKEDTSDSNKVINNHIGPGITAECIDVKEGSTGGFISGNYFDATGITGANSGDSWMDVKGNGYVVDHNHGFNPEGSILKDGFQVHCAVDGWGNNNVFRNNLCEVNADGYAINVTLTSSKGKVSGTKVYNNNTVKGAAKGLCNIEVLN